MALTLKENIPFADLGSYKIGGPVRFLALPGSEDEIFEAIQFAKENSVPLFVLGGGTNLLMRDEGFPGFVIRPNLIFIERKENNLRIGAGLLVAEALNYAIEHSLSGLEWAGGLPGTIGGGVRGNAGCFGNEMKDIVLSVESINLKTGEKVMRNNTECEFGYRSSIFKTKLEGREIITAATFSLTPKDPTLIKEVADGHIQYRKDRQPLEYPNIGSIFKNVDARGMTKERLTPFRHVLKIDPFPVIPTAYLIAEAGLKGAKYGQAMISDKHPNFIINLGGAKASDVTYLIQSAEAEVQNKFGITIHPEIIQI